TMNADPAIYPCLGNEFGPVTVPAERLWVMGDNRTHSADSRSHCTSTPEDAQKGLICTGDPMNGTIPVENVIGKAQFIAWPPSRWGGVNSDDAQQGGQRDHGLAAAHDQPQVRRDAHPGIRAVPPRAGPGGRRRRGPPRR